MKDYKGKTLVVCTAGRRIDGDENNKQSDCIHFQPLEDGSDPDECRYHEECNLGCMAFCNHKLEYGRK